MQKKFLSELFMLCLPYISVALSLAGVLLIWEGQPYMLLIIVIIFALFLIVFNLYKYNKKEVTKTTIAECLWDIYASPIKGKYIELEWTIIGKWVPWYIFTEDMMLQDRSWLMYMDYQAPIPLLGNVFFALTKVKKLVDQKISSTGWFFRWQTSLFKPDIITHENGQIKSYNQLYGMLIPIGLVAIAILIYIK
jgi:Ca2+/Na+ antiporter